MSHQGSKNTLTPQQAFVNAQKYCAYQDRCQKQVFEKLQEWGLNEDQANEILIKLLQENFLNEERFTRSYVRGKVRIKRWGRIKIIAKLNQFQVGKQCIKAGLEEIDLEEYLNNLQKEIAKHPKAKTYPQKANIARKMQQKGYETDLIWEVINKPK